MKNFYYSFKVIKDELNDGGKLEVMNNKYLNSKRKKNMGIIHRWIPGIH